MCISTDLTSLKTSIIIYIFVIYYFENRVEKIYWFKMLIFQHKPDIIFGVFQKVNPVLSILKNLDNMYETESRSQCQIGSHTV